MLTFEFWVKLPDELAEVVAEKLTVNLNINAPTEQHLSYLRVSVA